MKSEEWYNICVASLIVIRIYHISSYANSLTLPVT